MPHARKYTVKRYPYLHVPVNFVRQRRSASRKPGFLSWESDERRMRGKEAVEVMSTARPSARRRLRKNPA